MLDLHPYWVVLPFKEKEKERGEGRSQLDGPWKVPMFGGQWKEKEKHLFTSFHQQNLLKPSFSPLILRFYFMVLGHYLCISFFFFDL
jgi:hypothetical protein